MRDSGMDIVTAANPTSAVIQNPVASGEPQVIFCLS